MCTLEFSVTDRGAVATSHDGARLRSLAFEIRGKDRGGMGFPCRVSGSVRGIATGPIGRQLSKV